MPVNPLWDDTAEGEPVFEPPLPIPDGASRERLLAPGVWISLLAIGRRQAERHSVPAEEVEDCALEFVYRLTGNRRHHARLDTACPRFRPFAYRCAANHALDYRRRLHTHQRPLMSLTEGEATFRERHRALFRSPAGLSQPEAHVLRVELRRRLDGAIDHLEPDQRRVFAGYAEGESFGDLAHCMGRSENAVRLLYRRARQRLQRYLLPASVAASSLAGSSLLTAILFSEIL